jgi:biopolymer transport protein ExbD
MDGYEVLLQYDWCGVLMTLANPAPIAPANPATACLPAPPPPTAPPVAPPPAAQPVAPIPLAVAARNALVRSNIASLRLRCVLDTTCRGRLKLVPRTAAAARVTSYGTASYSIKAGKSKAIRVKLTAAGKVIFGDGISVDREIQASAVVSELRDKLNAVKAGSEKVVFVDFEHGVKWSDVVGMMDTLRSMATDPNHDEVKVALTICDWDKRQQSGCLKPGAAGQ